ncbi:MAG TPA: M14 family zinc carboxypeptidase [Pyrinomonadaceae bacterium]|nr:M14 family zinc carboxypeptidase [Pyrinomonadaceae bacterium]
MSPELRRVLAIFVFVVFAAGSALAQTDARNNTESTGASAPAPPTKSTPVNPKYTTPKSPLDTAYGAKIAEYTTEKYFMTELVDHLPLSDKVPSPEKVLGYAVGTPNKLTYTKDLYRYYRELAKASPRVRVLVAPEKSEEGREQMLVLVSDEENLAKLDRYKEITAKLADPRKLSDTEAHTLISEGKPFYWASGSIHSPETGSPEMLMEMAYRLAVEDSPFIEDIRKNMIVMITPALEVDGRDRMVDLYNYRKANPGKPAPPLLYWGKYVAHDNNRDGLGLALALTRNQMKTFLDYHPTVLHDLHESVPYLYTMTGTGPYNAWLDPLAIDEFQLLAYHEIEEMTKRGVPGVWTHGFYDGWAPNYMLYIATGHNAIGRFYETFGNGGADTRERTLGANQTSRVWYRPNPPFPRVKWSMRNNVNMQQSAILFAMNFVATEKERFLNNFYLKSKRSIAKAANEGPAAYIIPGDTPRPVEAADMVNLLRLQGVEVHRATKEFSVKDQKYPAGSYIVRMDQPYSRMADMLLDTQYYNVSDPAPYDDTGWTMGAMRNVKTVRVVDKSVLDAPATLLTQDAKVTGQLSGPASAIAYLINHNTDNTLATLRFRLKDVKMSAAEDSFKVGDQQYNTGSFIIKKDGNPADLRSRLESAATELGLKAVGVEKLPEVKTHELAVPRIAIVHTWTNTQNEGWYRIEFDKYQIPYTYISDHVIRNTPNLREKFDVLIFPPVGGSAQAIVNGMPRRGDPIPWKASAVTPNFGNSPDQTDDMRGGMTVAGVANLQKFIEDGGLFITIGGVSQVPIDYGITSGVSIQPAERLQARGSIYNSTFSDRKSPIAYGYDAGLPIYFSQSPLFQVQTGGGGGFGGGGGGGGQGGGAGSRASGRGGVNDPDVIQAMPQPRPADPNNRPDPDADLRESPFFTPPQLRPRVVLRFASDEKNLLISGMLAGGNELANRPAIVDVPVGRGHVVMFATNPMWRHQTQGEFFLVFNAALNYDNLNVGRTEPRGQGQRPSTADGDDQ